MALPPYQRVNFDPSEHVFLASQTTRIKFVPNFSMEPFRTLDGAMIGPFVPARAIEVPLWVALSCKKRRKGKVVCPEWLSVERLTELCKMETTGEQFSAVPFRWLEESKLLLEVASDDIPSADKVRALLKDLREARQSKSREGLAAIDTIHLETRNLSALEINELRPFFSLAHTRLLQLDPQGETYEKNIAEQDRRSARGVERVQQQGGMMTVVSREAGGRVSEVATWTKIERFRLAL